MATKQKSPKVRTIGRVEKVSRTRKARAQRGPAGDTATNESTNVSLGPVLLAVAATAKGVSVDLSQSPPATTPRKLTGMRFNDPRVGLSSTAKLNAWRNNLVQLLPSVQGSAVLLSLTPTTTIGEAALQVSKLIGRATLEQTGPTILVPSTLTESRKRVADRWGTVLASKSSLRLLQRLTGPARESMGGMALSTSGLVLEFNEQTALPILAARATSRTQRLASRRDAFYRLISPVCADIEKATGVPAVQRCWLNSTVRVLGSVAVIAAVADHNDLETVDVPRFLRREMNVAGIAVAATVARKNLGVSGRGIRVAVIDGEVNVTHSAFGTRATLQENLTSESFGSPDAHGTAVAAIIAASDERFSGIAPEAMILSYKVFPTGSDTGGDFEGILALEHALRDGADVANCSWGIGSAGDGSSRHAKALNNAWLEGLVIVKSAGNDGPATGTMTSPADADGVIVVGATEREGTAVQNYSSRGPTMNGKHPHLVAPGGTQAANIVTCLPAAAGGFGNSGFGTSLAAPVVSGAAALLLERFPTATSDDIRTRMLGMCRSLGRDVNTSGAGVLDLARFTD